MKVQQLITSPFLFNRKVYIIQGMKPDYEVRFAEYMYTTKKRPYVSSDLQVFIDLSFWSSRLSIHKRVAEKDEKEHDMISFIYKSDVAKAGRIE